MISRTEFSKEMSKIKSITAHTGYSGFGVTAAVKTKFTNEDSSAEKTQNEKHNEEMSFTS